MDDLKEKIGNWQLKEETLDRIVWRIRCGRGYGPIITQSIIRYITVKTVQCYHTVIKYCISVHINPLALELDI